MILAIDGYEANVLNRAGIGSYAFEIISGIYNILPQTDQARVYLPSEPLPDMPAQKNCWDYQVRNARKLWTLFGLPLALRQKPMANVVFSPTHYIPRFTSIPRVMAIMDLSYIYYPELFKKKDLHQLVNWTKFSVSRARAILTISEFSKNDIIKTYKIDKHKVFVTYPGFRMKISDLSNTTSRYSLNKPYILSVGTIQPRKNYIRLIEAFSKLKHIQKFSDLELVIVGKKGWLFEEILLAPQKFGVLESVKFLDFVPDEDLPLIYKQAQFFILPSLYEGFGLPVLEAMHHSKIVVVSNNSSLPEITGDSGILINPQLTESILDGMKQALSEIGTQIGENRILSGLEYIKKFNWQTAAKQTLDILEKVVDKQI